MSLEAVVLEHSYELKAEGMRVIHGFLGVRSRKETGYQTVMERSYWALFESSSEAPLGRILLFLRTEGPRACEGPASTAMQPHGPQMGSAIFHAGSWQETDGTLSWAVG